MNFKPPGVHGRRHGSGVPALHAHGDVCVVHAVLGCVPDLQAEDRARAQAQYCGVRGFCQIFSQGKLRLRLQF